MKPFFTLLTIGLIVIGFAAPLAWGVAVVTAVVAIGASPPGRRADGIKHTGGLLGGVWDNMMVNASMADCPYCHSKIKKTSQKCVHCGEWVTDQKVSDQQPSNTTVKQVDFNFMTYEQGENIPDNTWYQMTHWKNKRFVNYTYVIPKGWKPVDYDVPIAGISRGSRGQDLITIAQSPDFQLYLESDPTNPIDPRALKIFVSGTITDGHYLKKDVGYVPAEMMDDIEGLPLDVLPHSLFLPPSPDLNVGAKVVLITREDVKPLAKTVDVLIDELSKKEFR